MKNIFVLPVIFLGFLSCEEKERYVPEHCSTPKVIAHSGKLQLLDTLPGFYPLDKKKRLFTDLRGERILVLVKKEIIYPNSLLNSEIHYKNLGELAQSKKTDLLVVCEYKIANLYGVKIDFNTGSLTHSVLFIVDKNRVIQKMYKDVCEEDIIQILKTEKLWGTKNNAL